MPISKELEKQLKETSPEIQQYVSALQAENLRLVKRVANVEAKLTTANSMIEVYKKGKIPDERHFISDEELIEIIKKGK